MSFDIGINFRSTNAGAFANIDGANETYCLGASDIYPTTRAGFTFGWVSAHEADGKGDRQAGNDRRLAGINYATNDGTPSQFKLDLPASGSSTIHLAMGDGSYSKAYQYVKIQDGVGGTNLVTIDDSNGTGSQHFDDATGTDLTNVTWPGSETGVAVSFTGTLLYLLLGSPGAQSAQSTLAHLRVVQAGGATGSLFRPADLSGLGSGGPFFSNPLGRAPGGAWPARRHRRKRFVDLGVRP